MRRSKLVRVCRSVALLLVAAAVGCAGDPVARKQRFLESGSQYFEQEKYSAAIIQYMNALEIDPALGEARKRLAQSYAQTGDGQRALEQFIRAADLLPQDIEVQLTAGTYLLAARRPDDALARATAALAIDPDNVAGHLLKGNALAGLNSFDDALKAIEQAIRLDPARGATFTNLGVVELARGRRNEAEVAFKRAVELAPKSVEAHLALGNFYWSSGKRVETEKAFGAALSIDPNSFPANRAMAALAIASRRYRDAEPYLLRLAGLSDDPNSLYTLTDYYLASGRPKDAIVRLEELAAQTPDVVGVGQRLARAYAASGDMSKAKELVEKVLSGNPAALDAQLLKGQLLLTEGRRDEALDAVRAAATANPEAAEAQFALGRLYAARGDIIAAEAAFREVLRINPRVSAAQLEISRLQLSSGNANASVAMAEEAMRTQPGNAPARLALVRSLMAAGDLKRAESEMAALREAYPKVAAVHAQAATLAILRNELAGARLALNRAQELDARSIDVLVGSIALDFKTNNAASAIDRIDRRLKEEATPGLLLLGARTYWSAKDPAMAESLLRRAIEADPSSLPAYEMLGQLYISQNKLDQARIEFEALARKQANPVAPLTMSGIILQTQGKTDLAKKRYEEVLAIDSRAAIAANNLAWMLADSGEDLDSALKLAQTALEQAPDQPEVMDTVGWVYYKKDLPELAIPLFARCVERAPNRGVYHYHLGLAYHRADNAPRARASFERALSLGVGASDAAEIRRLLAQK